MSETPSALVCRGLVKRYGSLVAVNGLDLEVRAGECFGLLGPNGAGKTTTVEICEGLLEPDAGEVSVLGQHWGGDALALRARLGIQLQETKFPEKLKVREVITLFRSFYPRGPSVAEALALVQLQEKQDAYVKTLSGGQKQRLSLACALVGDPELLFLDEPTTGLDPQSRLQSWDIVEALKSRGRTVLLTTHYMEEAEALCDRIAVVDHGKILAEGTVDELLANSGAQTVVTVRYEEPVPDGLAERAGLTERPGVTKVEADGDQLRVFAADPEGLLGDLVSIGAANGLHVRDATQAKPSLETAFLALTGREYRE